MKKIKLFYVLVLISLILSGCTNALLPDIPDVVDPGPSVTTYTLINELNTNLSQSSSYTDSQILEIINSAKSAVGTDNTDIKGSVDNIVDGSLAALGSSSGSFTALDTTERLALIDLVINSVMISLNQHKSVALSTAARAIDPYAASMEQVLAQIAAAAIRNLTTAGIAKEDIGTAAESTINSLMGALDEGGVQAEEVPSVIQVITQAAVENIIANDDSSVSIIDAVISITEGAVSAIDDIQVNGFNDTMVADVVGGITAGATEAIEDIADDIVAADQTAATTTMDAISELSTAITTTAISQTTSLVMTTNILEITETVTAEAIEAISEIEITGFDATDAGDTDGLISEITMSAITTAVNSGAVESEAQVAVVTGASEGAQALSDDYDSAALEGVIIVDDSGTTVGEADITVLDEAVTDGIEKAGNEAPVADAGDNRSSDITVEITLDGSGSTEIDTNDSIVSYYWWIAEAPAESTAVIISDTSMITTFTPDVIGLYTIGLEVTDTFGETDTNYMQIGVAIETYEGLNVAERLIEVSDLYDSGELSNALTEVNKIFTFYPQSNFWSEAYLLQGNCLWDLNRHNDAIAAYNNVRSMDFDNEHYGLATRSLGWLNQWWNYPSGSLDSARTYFEELRDDARFSGTSFIGDGLHGLGYNYMKRDEYTTARTTLDLALAEPNTSNNEIFWSKFHYGESYLMESNDHTSAFTHWDAMLSDTATFCLDNDDATDYWKIQKIYQVKADVYYGLGDEVNALAQYQAILDYAGMPNEFKVNGSKELGSYYRDLGDEYRDNNEESNALAQYAIAEPYFENAWTFSDQNNDGTWAYVDLAWMYRNWFDMLDDGAAKNTVIADFLTVCTSIIATDYDEPKVHALINRGGYYQWHTDSTEYDNAYSDLSTAVSISENLMMNEAVWARFELANHYRDRAWNVHQDVTEPWASYFNSAINNYNIITVSNYPNYDDWMSRFFTDAKKDIADCYRGLGDYTQAINHLTSLISDSSFTDDEKAWFQFEIGGSYADLANEYREDGNFGPAATAISNSNTALLKAITDAQGLIDEQNITDRANRIIGQNYRHLGYIYDEQDDETNANINFYEAIDYYTLVSTNDDWDYFDAQRHIAECYTRVGDYQDASDTFDLLITFISTSSEIDDEEIDYLKFEKADALRDKYNDTALSNDYDTALIAYNDVLAIIGLSAETTSRANSGKGRLIRDYAHMTYRDQGLNDIEFENLMVDAIAAFTAATNVADDFEDWGNDSSEAFREIGYSYRDKANNYAQRLDWNVDNGFDITIYRSSLDSAIASFDNAMDTVTLGSIDENQFNDAKRGLIETNFEIAMSYDLPTEFASAETYIQDAMSLGFEVLDDDGADDYMKVDVMRGFGDINIGARGNSTTINSLTYNFSLGEALFWYNTIISDYNDLEMGRYGAQAQIGIGRANKADGNDLMNVSDYTGAIDAFILAVEACDLVSTTYSLPDDQWILDQAEWEMEDAYFYLADAYVQNGNIQDASDTYDIIIAMGTGRQSEAQGYKDNL